MQINLNKDYENLSPILSISPGRLRFSIIFLLILITIFTGGTFLILYFKWNRLKNIINHLIFEIHQEDTPETSYYLIVDSKSYNGKNRQIYFSTHIIWPYLVRTQQIIPFSIDQQIINEDSQKIKVSPQAKLCKYLEHKQLLYLIKDNTLLSLKLKIKTQLASYCTEGLNLEQIKQNKMIYGQASNFCLRFWHILFKIINRRRLRFAFFMLTYKKIILQYIQFPYHSIQISFLIEIGIALVITLIITFIGMIEHNKIFAQFDDQIKYQAIRNGQKQQVKLNDLVVGDIVIPNIKQIIYFKGIFASSQTQHGYAVVNEKFYNRKDDPIQKYSLVGHLNQILQHHLINPGSQILNLSVKLKDEPNLQRRQVRRNPKFYIIVIENNSLQKYFQLYRQTHFYDNYSSSRINYDAEHFIFSFILFVVCMMITIWVTGFFKHDKIVTLILSLLILIFPFNLVIFTSVSQLISIIRLKKQSITTINPALQQIGMTECLTTQLSIFDCLKFHGYVKKQRCHGIPQPETFSNVDQLFRTFRNRQDSIEAFLLYVGMMNINQFQNIKVYRQLFDHLQFSQSINENSSKIIKNTDSSVMRIEWQQVKRYQISDQLIQTVLVKNQAVNRDRFVLISQGYFTNQNCQSFFHQNIRQSRSLYLTTMKQFKLRGMRVKYIAIKKNITIQQSQIQSSGYHRQNIQKQLTFGGFVVFDDWPDQINLQILSQLNKQSNRFSKIFLSSKQQCKIIGFDHLLNNSQIKSQQESIDNKKTVEMLKRNNSTVTNIGFGILNQSSLLMSDVAINIKSKSPAQADFQLQNSTQIITLLEEGHWQLETVTITIICLTLINLSKLLIQIILYNSKIQKGQIISLSLLLDRHQILDMVSLFVPILLLNLYEPRKKLIKNIHSFFRINYVVYIVISIMGFIFLLALELLNLNPQHNQIQLLQNNKADKNYLSLRSNQQVNSQQNLPQSIQLESILIFIKISFQLLVIVLIDIQTNSRVPRNIFLAHLNKIFMLLLWIFTISFYLIPFASVLKATILLSILIGAIKLVEMFQYKHQANSKNNPKQQIQ